MRPGCGCCHGLPWKRILAESDSYRELHLSLLEICTQSIGSAGFTIAAVGVMGG